MNRALKRYKRDIIPVYTYFKSDLSHLKYDEEALIEMFLYESEGIGDLDEYTTTNGWFIAKKMMDITLANWKETLQEGSIIKYEILEECKHDQVLYDFVSNFLDGIYIPPRKDTLFGIAYRNAFETMSKEQAYIPNVIDWTKIKNNVPSYILEEVTIK